MDVIEPRQFPEREAELAAALATLDEGYGDAAYGEAVHRRRVEQHRATLAYVTDVESGRVVGCGYVADNSRLAACAVLPGFTGRGVASAIIQALRERSWPMSVEVGQEAPLLTAVLLRAGFAVVGSEDDVRWILRDLDEVNLRWLGGGVYVRDRVEGPGTRTFQLLVGGDIGLLP